jgi:hypothetical protein
MFPLTSYVTAAEEYGKVMNENMIEPKSGAVTVNPAVLVLDAVASGRYPTNGLRELIPSIA